MSSGNAYQEQLGDSLDAGILEEAPAGKLEDAEIQRLVALSNDASYARSDRIPVKTVEAFEPRSLVSIAMAAQRRRESEMRTAVAAGAVIGDDATPAVDEAAQAGDTDAGLQLPETPVDGEQAAGAHADGEATAETQDENSQEDAAGESDETAPSSTSQVDFEAGRQEGLEEGRRVGLEEGHAKGMEEGRAAGRAEASAQLERAMQAFEAATARLSELAEVDSAALSDSINNAVLQIASERAGQVISELPDGFADRIEALLASIRTVSGQPSIRLNPADLASIQPLAETREKLRHCNFVADPALAHGDLSVMIGTIGIDDMLLDPRPSTKAGSSSEDAPQEAVREAREDADGQAEASREQDAVPPADTDGDAQDG